MLAVCINAADTTTLVKGKQYYVFPNGSNHAYVSKFDNPSAHFGCYRQSLFEEVSEDAPVRPPEPRHLDWELEPNQVYQALMGRTDKDGFWHLEGQMFYVRQHEKYSGQVRIYRDPQCTKYKGQFMTHWFTDFEAIEVEKDQNQTELDTKVELLPDNDWEQMKLF